VCGIGFRGGMGRTLGRTQRTFTSISDTANEVEEEEEEDAASAMRGAHVRLGKGRTRERGGIRCIESSNGSMGRRGELTDARGARVHRQVAELWTRNQGCEADETLPYAEFWMGAHVGAPSHVEGTSQTSLKDWIEAHPESMGEEVPIKLQGWRRALPFLFKVLSVGTALSIQAHPDASLAVQLRKRRPEAYPDDKPKPEMAVALRDFEALCGFRDAKSVAETARNVPELEQVIGGPHATQALGTGEEKALRDAFRHLMNCEPQRAQEAAKLLVDRLRREMEFRTLCPEEEWALELAKQYPGDVGIFCVFVLNLLRLKPGEAVALGANEPHAYLKGDIVEIMAASDNVVRAGLTPKFRDTQVLCDMLTYKQGTPEVMQGEETENGVVVYRPPFPEFELHRISLEKAGSKTVRADKGPSIFLVYEGTCDFHADKPALADANLHLDVEGAKGTVVFLPAHTQIQLTARARDAVVYQAKCNEKHQE